MVPVLPNGTSDEQRAHSPANLTFYFSFTHPADSSKFRLTVGEFYCNDEKLRLANWCSDRVVNAKPRKDEVAERWTSDELRGRSTTRAFRLRPGDTISFYRHYWWVDGTDVYGFDDEYRAARHINVHQISYSTELVNAFTHERVRLLDTFSISAVKGTDEPCIRSWFPPLSRVMAYADNAEMQVYIRMNVYDNGNSGRPIERRDESWPYAESLDHLSSDYTLAYNDRAHLEPACTTSEDCVIRTAPARSSKGIRLTISDDDKLDRIRIFDVTGTEVWSTNVPFTSKSVGAPTPVGLHIVVGEHHGQTICTKAVLVE